ncbi:hypothetical protein ACFYXF_47695 [Streptomyces sp. NPDC002680]|uniref:hypothetical protein n=1 Tax=Streptomyces sp. NPDC002680 TaxID=3364659 RepID=UPI0036CF9192
MMVGRRHSPTSEQRSSALFVSRSVSAGRAGPESVPLYGFQPPVGTPYGLEVTTVEDFTPITTTGRGIRPVRAGPPSTI